MRALLTLPLASLPIALFVWACSSDEPSGPGTLDGGSTVGIDVAEPDPTPTPDAEPPDAGTADAGPTCVGNPLTADGTIVDGGVILDAAVARRILDESAATGLAPAFVDGPQYVDFNGGSLVFAELFSTPPTLVRINADGGARTVIRTATTAPLTFFIGSAQRNGVVLTVQSAGDLTAAPAIVQTLPDGGDGGANLSVGGIAFEPNDLVIGPKGDIYFTDPQYQVQNDQVPTALYRRQPDGKVVTILAPLDRVNGIALSPDATRLYVTITDLKHVLSFDVAGDGTIVGEPTSIPKTVVETTPDHPDGMGVDVGGNLWIAEAAAGGAQSGRVEVYTPAGKKLGEIPFPGERPTGVAFGGADDKSVFVTTEKGVWSFSSRCAGLR
jgi:sugar lactone lactonase YvrE